MISFLSTSSTATRALSSHSTRARPNVPSEHMAGVQAIRYNARDGMEISAYLTTPKGASGQNRPALMAQCPAAQAQENPAGPLVLGSQLGSTQKTGTNCTLSMR